MPARWSVLPVLLALAAPAAAQSSPDQQARRLLEDGRQYFAKQQYKQALDNFNTIVSGFSGTDSVDDALLEIGRYYMEAAGDEQKARQAFEEVTKHYPQSDGAPGAYYYLGWLSMNKAASPAALDDALAQFQRIRTLYPRSEWVAKAYYAAGLVHRKAGRLADAVDFERRASLEYPLSDAAAAAQFEIGHCLALMGEPRQAMEEYQQVRNRFPGSDWAARALEQITALYRLYGASSPTFRLDPAYAIGGGDVLKDVRAILMTPAGTLWIASDKVKSVVPFDPDGKMGPSLSAEDLRSLSLSPKGQIVATAKLAVRIGPKDIKTFAAPSKPGQMESLDKLTAAVVTPGGNTLVADEKTERVYRYDDQFKYLGPFPDSGKHEISRMLLDQEGGIVMLDKDEKTVRVYDEAGRLLRTLGGKAAGVELKHPADVAVDAVRNFYVADEEAGVLVFSPQGKLITTLASDELRRPKAVALDPSGAVLVYDDKSERILRFK